jgi:F-type H+-transporting ATPase subunit a
VFAGFALALGAFGVAPLLVATAITGLEVVIAFLQAYVFTVLTCLYLHDALYMH